MNQLKSWLRLLSHIRQTGAIAFSSGNLANKMVNRVNFGNADVIVELGGGCGCITKSIVKHKKPDTKLLIFEIRDDFCQTLRAKFAEIENVFVINDSAENMDQHLMKLTNRSQADYIISSLPFSIIEDTTRKKILSGIETCLGPKSLFIQFGYNKRKYKSLLSGFQTLSTSFVLGNLPPAYVFNCKPYVQA